MEREEGRGRRAGGGRGRGREGGTGGCVCVTAEAGGMAVVAVAVVVVVAGLRGGPAHVGRLPFRARALVIDRLIGWMGEWKIGKLIDGIEGERVQK